MKQLMVLIATIVLGVSISGIVLGFGGSAKTISTNVSTGIESVGTKVNTALTDAGVTIPASGQGS